MASYGSRPKTATEAAIRRIKREESLTRAIRNARAGRRRNSDGPSLVDAFVLAAIGFALVFVYQLFRALFLAARWGFRRLRY
jgi:hypothetical protein